MGGAVIPLGLLFALGLLSADAWGQIFPKWPPPEQDMLLNIPESFAFNVFPSQQATFTPVFPGCPPKLQSGLTQIPMETLLCPGTSARESLCAPFKNGVFISHSPVELLRTSPTGLQCQMLQGSFSLCQIPTRESLMCGSELSLLYVSL